MCYNLADIYVELLKKIGIKAFKQSAYYAWVIFEISDMFIYANVTIHFYNDLTRIKYHEMLIYFQI